MVNSDDAISIQMAKGVLGFIIRHIVGCEFNVGTLYLGTTELQNLLILRT